MLLFLFGKKHTHTMWETRKTGKICFNPSVLISHKQKWREGAKAYESECHKPWKVQRISHHPSPRSQAILAVLSDK